MKTRKKNERFIAKRKSTRMGTIEKEYNVDLGVRSDMKLGDYLKKKGYKSLSDMLEE